MKRLIIFLKTSKGLIVPVVLVILIFCIYVGTVYFHYFRTNPSVAGTFGDMFGGANALFSAFTVILVFYAAMLQKKELDETRQEFKQQNETSKLQRFETTFFNLLSLYSQIKRELAILVMDEEINDPEFKRKIESNYVFTYVLNFIHNEFELAEYKSVGKTLFEGKYNSGKDRECEIPHYYNHIMNTFQFIKESRLSPEQTKFYSKTFYNLFAPIEVALVFYYIGLKKDMNQSLKEFIIQQGVFESIDGEPYFGHPSYWYINFPQDELQKEKTTSAKK